MTGLERQVPEALTLVLIDAARVPEATSERDSESEREAELTLQAWARAYVVDLAMGVTRQTRTLLAELDELAGWVPPRTHVAIHEAATWLDDRLLFINAK